MKLDLKNLWENLFYPYRIFTFLALFFLAGILLASYLDLEFYRSWAIFVFIFLAVLFCSLINFFLKNRFITLLCFGAISVILAVAYFSYYSLRFSVELPYGEKLTFQGKIVERPAITSTDQQIVVEYTNIEGEKARVITKVPTFPVFHYADKVELTGKLEKPQNFSEFDYAGYLKGRRILAVIDKPEDVHMVESKRTLWDDTLRELYRFSGSFEAALNKVLTEPQASLASGLLLGVKRNISDAMMLDLQKTGLTHIIALSGFNITIIIAILADILLIYLGRRWTFFSGTLLVLAFVLMTGANSSVVRAAIFSILVLSGGLLGRRADQTNLMLLAAVCMAIFNPLVVRYDVGFQLSFLAFAGLIYLSPRIMKSLEKIKFLPKFVTSGLGETLGAQIFVSPLIFFKFGTVSLIGPVANLLVVWIIPISMAFVFITGTLALIYYPLGKVAAWLLWPFLEYIVKMVEWLAKLPWAAIIIK
jgi:competence protein ComEC